MSPDQGRRTLGKGGSGAAGPAAARRLGLLIFGVGFVVLFAWVAIAEGVGDPSIPSGSVALVQGAPGDIGDVTEAEFKHALELSAAQGGLKQTPKPGEPKYDELKEAALNSLLESIWLQGLAAEWGIEATDKEVAAKLKEVKKESFKTEAEFQEFLKKSHYTPADVSERVRLQILSEGLQNQLKENIPTPSQSEVDDYYAAAKDTQFTQKASRDVRTIVNKDRKKVEEALEALRKDNSAKNWTKLAKKYSTDPNTKATGGLQKGLQEGTIEEPLNAAIFGTPEGQVEGPVNTKFGYTIYEVVNSTPESVQEQKAVESQIKSTLAQRAEQEYFAAFTIDFSTEWKQRTFCASGYLTERCGNFKSDSRPAAAPPACYEADPKGGRPAACPAPVFQLIPALPGSVTPLEPTGKPLAQRPRPAGSGSEVAAGATEELPPGAVPPAEEAPAEEAPPEEPSE